MKEEIIMRKWYIIALVVILVIVTVTFISFLLFKNNSKNEIKVEKILSKQEENTDNNNMEVVTTSAKEQEDIITEETYIIKEKDGYIAIYELNKNGKEILKEITQIVTKYLPDIDKLKLQEGIKVVGKEKLVSILENYE